MLDEYKTLDKKKFINKYGHLRPGTFDISIDNYESNFSRYLNTKNYVLKSKSSKFNLIEVINKTKMSQVIPNDLFGMSLENLVKFFTVSIKMREYSKFIYTKNISDALELIKIVGDNYNLDKYELSHLNYNVIKNSVANSDNIESILKESIIKGKNDFDLSRLIKLPPLIFERNHIWEFEWPQFTANFITEAIVDGKIASSGDDNLKDKIVIIKNADPGFDWIFSKKIKAFITAYGGSNSHMAIRANELQIPAAIGIGEKLFDEIKNATDVKLDCLNKKISYE
jgi:phosphohistidine swiveling domain-containing protein